MRIFERNVIRRLRTGIAIITLTWAGEANAQKQTQRGEQFWSAYMTQTRLSDKWGVWADFHLRTREDVFTGLSTFIGRVGATYYFSDNLRFTAGYGFVNHYPSGTNTISQPEHRPWQQLQWFTAYPKLRLAQYIRLEERFRRKLVGGSELGDGHDFNYRWRYNIMAMLPLGKKAFAKNSLSLVLNDEVHVNMGKEVINYFDQNRLFLGLAYHVGKSDNIQVGYMHFFQQLSSPSSYRILHVPRIAFFHNIDLR